MAEHSNIAQGVASLRRVVQQVRSAPVSLLQAAGVELVGQIKQELSQPGTGRIYRRGAITHQASAPGEPPAPDTGQLRNSIQMAVLESDDGTAVLRVGTGLEYAAALEFGTTSAGRGHTTVILPRPFMRPALAKARVRMGEEFLAEAKLVVQSVGGAR